MCKQATLGELYSQPPLTQDANVATDGTMMLEIVEQPPEENKPAKDIQEGLPYPSDPARASMEAAVVDDATLAAQPTVLRPSVEQEQLGDEVDIVDASEVPEVRIGLLLLVLESFDGLIETTACGGVFENFAVLLPSCLVVRVSQQREPKRRRAEKYSRRWQPSSKELLNDKHGLNIEGEFHAD